MPPPRRVAPDEGLRLELGLKFEPQASARVRDSVTGRIKIRVRVIAIAGVIVEVILITVRVIVRVRLNAMVRVST